MKKYNVIYADPAWSFKTYSEKGKGRSAENHYTCSSLEDMRRLKVKDIAAENSVCFMWATYPNLLEAMDLLCSYGFVYKTVAFTWVKQNKKQDTFFMGLGYYTRANPEICLLGTKGNPLPRQNKGVQNLVIDRIREHSRKPDLVRIRIEQLFGDLPRIELFARERVPGWDAFGNEIESDVML